MKNITLEMSLKPFKRIEDDYITAVCQKLFGHWKPLVKNADMVSVMLWTADGSEILDYDRNMDREIEWCHYFGGANPRQGWDTEADPDGISLHTRNYEYIENPPTITYGTLKNIISIIKRVGREVLDGKKIRVGETFDPGPEFAKSDFKYKYHNEICVGASMGIKSMVCCYSILNEDATPYAAYPKGIPANTPFGTFFGKQCNLFLADMGFDYIWFSNGFGFGTETWGTTGAIFDGEHFHVEKLDSVKENILKFWKLFRAECPDLPIETRGTNLSCGIDMATDGVPLKEIYDGGFNMLPPVNSPWAALDGDFGLELMGNMSRIAEIPSGDYTFRYYIHDPWWTNSPWYDRYEGQPHDIYLPLATARIDETGKTCPPACLNILSIDNTCGDMPDQCVYEPLPHLQKAFKDAPDAPSPVVWVYPFREYNQAKDSRILQEAFFGDWFIRDALNNGVPMSSVVSTDNFIKTWADDPALYDSSILVSTVPEADSLYEKEILRFIQCGGRVVFYGSVSHASPAFLDMVNVRLSDPVSGILPLHLESSLDNTENYLDTFHSGSYANKLYHRPLVCAGGIDTLLKDNTSQVRPIGYAGCHIIGTYGGNYAWIRGTCSCSYVPGNPLLVPDCADDYFIGAVLMRNALSLLGISVGFDKITPAQRTPVIMVNRKDRGFLFSIYSPDTTVSTKLKFPLGAPILLGYETELKEGFSTYRFPRADHRECRIFVEQEAGVLSCREHPPVSYQMRRRIHLTGLTNATVRFFPESYTNDVQVLLNSTYPLCVGETCEGDLVTDRHGTYYEARNVTGDLYFSLPRVL